MKPFIVIRRAREEDTLKCEELVKDYVMSFASKSFFACIFKEITIQCIVICWALLFIFLGVPLIFCALSIPGCIFIILILVYTSCFAKAMELAKIHEKQSWVAEAYEPFLINHSRQREIQYEFFIDDAPYDEAFKMKFKKKIIGTASLRKHNAMHNAGWISRFAINPEYPFSKVAEPMLNNIAVFCSKTGYNSIELLTTEWQENEREFYMKIGFVIRQIYHKQILGSNLTIMKSQLGLDLKEWKQYTDNFSVYIY